MIIFLKYNSDFCWKTSVFGKSMWAQERKLSTTQPIQGATSSYSLTHSDTWSDFSSSESAESKPRSSKPKMNRHRTPHTLVHSSLQLFSENNRRWMQPEASFIRAQMGRTFGSKFTGNLFGQTQRLRSENTTDSLSLSLSHLHFCRPFHSLQWHLLDGWIHWQIVLLSLCQIRLNCQLLRWDCSLTEITEAKPRAHYSVLYLSTMCDLLGINYLNSLCTSKMYDLHSFCPQGARWSVEIKTAVYLIAFLLVSRSGWGWGPGAAGSIESPLFLWSVTQANTFSVIP